MTEALGEELSGQLNDYKSLEARLRTFDYSCSVPNTNFSVHLHYPAFRQEEVTVADLIPRIANFLIHFCLPKAKLALLHTRLKKAEITQSEYDDSFQDLKREAKNLFINAHKTAKKDGECGELLLFILTEWILEAPQILAKMSLKTNASMPVHGADGIHCKYIQERNSLCFYFGESKLYQDVSAALRAAQSSITESLKPDKIKHELNLVSNGISDSALSPEAQEKLLAYLDPCDELSNSRETAITCLIAFEFSKYKSLDRSNAEQCFCQEAQKFLDEMMPKIQSKIATAGISKQIEIFFLPLPSVEKFRTLFQNEIGWRDE